MTEPLWLTKARSYIGFQEQAGNRGIQEFIALAHTGEEGDPWCAIFANACLESVGVKGTRSPAANSFTQSPLFVRQQTPQIGTICTFTRPGGNHVAFYTGIDTQGRLLVLGGNQGDKVGIEPHSTDTLTGYWWPAATAVATVPPIGEHPLIALGATGPAVIELQTLLKVPVTGTFDAATDAAVRAFQASRGLDVDGEVGIETWPALLAATATGRPSGLTQKTIDAIVALAGASELARHTWNNGHAPIGYTKGMAVVFGLVYSKWKAGDSAALAMAARVPANELDALSWYEGKLNAAGLLNNISGVDNLRNLFVLETGLGLRESSGRYCEGRDMSASNVAADTAEAGLFQQSWNSHTASPEIRKLFDAYGASKYPGLVEIFKEGVNFTATDNFGDGDGAAFQVLAKTKPAFAAEAAAAGLRVLRTHWGPINRHEAEIVPAADALFRQVQTIVDAQPINGDVIPPTKLDDELFDTLVFILTEGTSMDPNLKAAMIAELSKPNPNMRALLLQALGATSTTIPPALPPPAVEVPPVATGIIPGLDLNKLAPLAQNPEVQQAIQKAIGDVLHLIVPAVLSTLSGQPVQAFPAATTVPPVQPGAPVTAAPTTAGMSNTAFNWSAGIGAALASLGLSATGVIGAPMGADATTAGMLIPIISLAAGAFGIPAPVVSILGNIFSGVIGAAKSKPKA